MPLEQDPVSLLGAVYAQVRARLGGTEPLSAGDEPEEDGPTYGAAPDGRWECVLDSDGRIVVIFLFGDKGCRFPEGFARGMSMEQVRTVMGGPPSRSAPARDVPVLGWTGPAMRWDFSAWSVHAEFDADNGLRQLTYMTAERTPDMASWRNVI
jgi:hypothetical protein